MNATQLEGADKAAVLLLALGPELSSPIMKQMDDEALIDLAKRMPKLSSIKPEDLAIVCNEYAQSHRSGNPFLSSSADIKGMLTGVVDSARLDRIMESLQDGSPVRVPIWSKLSRMTPKTVFGIIKNENPQTIAIILGQLDPDFASSLIELFPEEMQTSVVVRMSKIESVSSDLIHDIEDALEKQLTGDHGGSGLSFDGMVRVVDILKTLDGKISKSILDHLRDKDPELFEQVDSQLLVFEDFTELSAKDIQTVLKHASSEDLVRALKGASDELREHFFSNMSQRAADMMREDMEVMGPLRVSDVEACQRNLLEVARKLDDEGAISLGTQEEMIE
jgi:flagellar motor switch protein FliG